MNQGPENGGPENLRPLKLLHKATKNFGEVLVFQLSVTVFQIDPEQLRGPLHKVEQIS